MKEVVLCSWLGSLEVITSDNLMLDIITAIHLREAYIQSSFDATNPTASIKFSKALCKLLKSINERENS